MDVISPRSLRRRTRPLAVLVTSVIALAGCGGGQTAANQGGEVGAERAAVATVYPLAWLVDVIAPGAEVRFLGARGQDPHDLELSPADREAIETADVLVYMGELDFQPQVERAVASATGEVVDVAAVAGGERLLRIDEDEHEEDEEGRDDEHDEEGSVDPHVWFDTTVMADVAQRVGEAFASADPGRAAEYAANATATAEDLEGLAGTLDELLADCRFDTVIVSHEAFGYLLHPRGREQEGISPAGGHSEASPQRLAELIDRVREEDIPAVAAEPFEGRADAEVLAAESGAQLVDVDPLEVVDDEQAAAGYPQLLREQAEAFATALDCA